MSRHVILGLAAAMLAGIVLAPAGADAHRRHGPHGHHGHYIHSGLKVCSERDHRGWNAFSRIANEPGHPGPHYGCDCYRAMSGRAMCRIY